MNKNEAKELKEADIATPNSEKQALEFCHIIMNDIQTIYSHLTSSTYALERFGSNTTDERIWRVNAHKAYKAKTERLEDLKAWMKNKGFKPASSLNEIEDRLILSEPLQAPSFITQAPNDNVPQAPAKAQKVVYDFSKSHILYEQCLARLKLARESANMSQQSVAEIFGVTDVTISSWETGKSPLRLINLLELCEVYNVDPGYILTGKRGKLNTNKYKQHIDNLSDIRDMFADLIDNIDLT